MSSLFRILEKKNEEIREIYDENYISGDLYMAILDYIEEYDIVFNFLQDFGGNADSYALEISPGQAQQVLNLLKKGEFAKDRLPDDWEYENEDTLHGIKVIAEYFEKLISQSEKSTLIFEIY